MGAHSERRAEACAGEDGTLPGQRGDAVHCEGHVGRKQSSIILSSSLLFVDETLLILASSTAGRETLRSPGHTELVSEDARWVKGVLAAPSTFGTALPTSDLHSVRVEQLLAARNFFACFFFLTTASPHAMYSLQESQIAPYLTELQERVKEEGVRVGSYPLPMKGVFVSLIGLDEERVRELGNEVAGRTQGKVVTEQEVRETKKGLVN